MRHRGEKLALVVGWLLVMVKPLAAQTNGASSDALPDESPAREGTQYVEGWDSTLSLGANVNLNSNDDVVGQVDGFSALFGLEARGGLYYLSGPHDLDNTLRVNESWARTPNIGQFVKNNDEVSLQSLYHYFFLDWAGGFGRASLETNLFATRQVTAQPQSYEIARTDDGTDTRRGLTTLRLSDPFAPTSLQQAGGVFAKPFRREAVTLTTRIGLGFHETLAKGVLVTDDNEETETIEIEELENIYQGGLEGFVGVRGEFQNGRIGYDAGITGFVPAVNNDPENRSSVQLFSYDVRAGVHVNVVDGVSASYSLHFFQDPQFLDEVQMRNSITLTVAYQIVERRGATPPLEDRLEEARKEADEAQKRVDDLESQLDSDDNPDTDTDDGKGGGTS